MHAKWFAHSLLAIHSGLQFGGEPIKSIRQEQDGLSLTTLHSAFGPQGDGWQGFSITGSSTKIDCNEGCDTRKTFFYLLIGMHRINGSPVCLLGQVHMGLWFTTWHIAPVPQVPGHGLIHFWLKHASFNGHSELVTHSGLHVGGLPMKPSMQEHTACLLISLHWLFGPQGEGWQGFVTTGSKIYSNNAVLV